MKIEDYKCTNCANFKTYDGFQGICKRMHECICGSEFQPKAQITEIIDDLEGLVKVIIAFTNLKQCLDILIEKLPKERLEDAILDTTIFIIEKIAEFENGKKD